MAYVRGRGFGDYNKLGGSYAWMFDPPPYDFLWPVNPAPDPPMAYPMAGGAGLGDCGCGGKCGGCGDHKHGHGFGLFESGMDYTQWGPMEWGAVAIGGYLALSIVGDMFTAGKAVREGSRRTKRAYRALKGRS